MQRKIKKFNRQNSQLIQIGFLLILFGIFIFSYQFIYKNKIKAHQTMSQKIYEHKIKKEEKTTTISKEETVDSIIVEPIKKEDSMYTTYNYIGYLEIPAINFKQGFLNKNDIHNNVEENITVLKESVYPEQLGNFIVAAHSGTGAIAYFNELYRLKEHDTIYVYYKNKKYTYEIVNIYKQPKNGTIEIRRDKTKSTLTLITCTNNDNTTQTVYIANQVNVS